MKAIIHAKAVLPDRILPDAVLLFDKRILAVGNDIQVPAGAEVLDAQGDLVSPGLIDTHIHGFGGDDASDADTGGLLRMSARLPEYGVTCFLPTTMTVERDVLKRSFACIREAMAVTGADACTGARIAGCHAEGPFINKDRCGAQDPACALTPDEELILADQDVIRVLTLAPELPGAPELIAALREKTGILISVGHTCGTYAASKTAFEKGATRMTHLFNAMTGLTHRTPGTVGAALTLPFFTELIADNIHVDPVLFPMLDQLKGDRLVLITDCTRAGGLQDGVYTLGGQEFLKKDGACRLPDGTLAGSVLTLDRAVRDLILSGVPVCRAVNAATGNAARSAGLTDMGTLRMGFRADLAIWDKDMNIRKTLRDGTVIFDRDKK